MYKIYFYNSGIEVNTEENELGTLDAIGDAAKTAMMSPIKKMLQGARKYSIVNHTMLNLDKHYLSELCYIIFSNENILISIDYDSHTNMGHGV